MQLAIPIMWAIKLNVSAFTYVRIIINYNLSSKKYSSSRSFNYSLKLSCDCPKSALICPEHVIECPCSVQANKIKQKFEHFRFKGQPACCDSFAAKKMGPPNKK